MLLSLMDRMIQCIRRIGRCARSKFCARIQTVDESVTYALARIFLAVILGYTTVSTLSRLILPLSYPFSVLKTGARPLSLLLKYVFGLKSISKRRSADSELM